jgi:hypothetical protein
VDLPVNVGQGYRGAKKDGYSLIVQSYLADWFRLMLPLAGREKEEKSPGDRRDAFWDNLAAYDENLLLVLDMLLHEEEWSQLFAGKRPADFLDAISGGRPRKIFEMMGQLRKILGQNQQRMYYLVAFRLQNGDQNEEILWEMLRALQAINLKHILQWERHAGLRFYKDYGFGGKGRIEELKRDDLYDHLQDVARVLAPYSGSIPHFSPSQGAIFSILAYRLRNHPQAKLWCSLLKDVDLTKILRFKSADGKLYFVDPKTNDREPNLLTQETLPADDVELAKRLTQAYRETYQEAPLLFNLVTLDQGARELLHLPARLEAKEEKSDWASTLRSILDLVQGREEKGVEERLSQSLTAARESPVKLPKVIVETALESAAPEVLLPLLRSRQGFVSIAALQVLSERQQTNKRLEARQLPELLYLLLTQAKKPDEQEALLIENLFHPEFLVAQETFLKSLLDQAESNPEILASCKDDTTAFGWWIRTVVRNFIWHQDAASILGMLRHPQFPLAILGPVALEALRQRQSAELALAAKLSRAEVLEILPILAQKDEVDALAEDINRSIPVQAIQQHPIPAQVVNQAPENANRSVQLALVLFLAGLVLGAMGIVLAATGALAPLGVALGVKGAAMALPGATLAVGAIGFVLPTFLWGIRQVLKAAIKGIAGWLQSRRSAELELDSRPRGGSAAMVFAAYGKDISPAAPPVSSRFLPQTAAQAALRLFMPVQQVPPLSTERTRRQSLSIGR